MTESSRAAKKATQRKSPIIAPYATTTQMQLNYIRANIADRKIEVKAISKTGPRRKDPSRPYSNSKHKE